MTTSDLLHNKLIIRTMAENPNLCRFAGCIDCHILGKNRFIK